MKFENTENDADYDDEEFVSESEFLACLPKTGYIQIHYMVSKDDGSIVRRVELVKGEDLKKFQRRAWRGENIRWTMARGYCCLKELTENQLNEIRQNLDIENAKASKDPDYFPEPYFL